MPMMKLFCVDLLLYDPGSFEIMAQVVSDTCLRALPMAQIPSDDVANRRGRECMWGTYICCGDESRLREFCCPRFHREICHLRRRNGTEGWEKIDPVTACSGYGHLTLPIESRVDMY